MKLSRPIISALLAAAVAVGGADYIIDTTATASESSSPAPAKKKKRRTSTKKRTTSRKRRTSTAKKTTTPVKPPETPSYDSLTLMINDIVIRSIPERLNPGGLRVNSVKPDSMARSAKVSLNENFTYLPITQDFISELKNTVSQALPDSLAGYGVTLHVGNRQLAYYLNKIDVLPPERRKNPPFVRPKEPYAAAAKGLDGDVVALWHSHGKYFKPGSGAWMWQRPQLFEVVEDTHTMGYILPYVVPMLENAGAYVMLPRERDTNRHEVIVDNDSNEGGDIFSQPYYKEKTGTATWTTGEQDGFIYDLKEFRDTENPFELGTYRQTSTIRTGEPSVAAWYADIQADGEYAVYVSYKSLPNSTADAHYAVNYSGGTREFIVNQQMGGGTWIYLGTFPLEKGFCDTEPIVTLTNITEGEAGTVLTADAVKIGGGMGNIARSNYRSDVYYDPSTPETITPDEEEADDESVEETEENEEETEEGEETTGKRKDTSVPADPIDEPRRGGVPNFRTSGLPRFLEGARYWLHWAGFPENVYSPYHGSDDYKDDYTSRGHWVNYLAGGSAVLPNREGLKIPVDVAVALHSDAGKRSDDSFVGTLGIYFTNDGDSYADGTARINSRMLTDLLMRQITGDVRQKFESDWTRRSMWDKTYVEARVPEVPTSLIELLSHQNYADMVYSRDPEFRFTVGRAMYKAIGRFLAERKAREFVCQPLAPKDFAIVPRSGGKYRLEWQPTPDPLEPTAMPTSYIVFERSGSDLGFKKIGTTTDTHFDLRPTDSDIHSFRVVAVNEGGSSFPSETLAMRHADGEGEPVLIVNGFTRTSGPANFSDPDGTAGFRSDEDFGVPYIKDISFIGHQTEFRRGAGESFGRSGGNYASSIIAGNTFDFPAVHGRAIADAGRGFVSTSIGAIERGAVKPGDYKIIDLILGKQKATVVGRGKSGVNHRLYPGHFRHEIDRFLENGGKLIVSGQYIASDAHGMRSTPEERAFAADVLGLDAPVDSVRTRSGRIAPAPGALPALAGRQIPYSTTLNEEHYIVERPDVLAPSYGTEAETLLEFTDINMPAALGVKRGKGRQVLTSVPFEAITDRTLASQLMKEFLNYLTRK